MTRKTRLPYGKHDITDADVAAVERVLRSPRLTSGPQVWGLGCDLAKCIQAHHVAVPVSSGTAALHLAYLAAGLGRGDEVIMSPLTFVATANAALYVGARPVFVDVSSRSLNIDPVKVEAAITSRTRAVVAMHYAGRSCDMKALSSICKRYNLLLIEDACHALGAEYYGKPVGSGMADLSCWSFHPVKHVAAGEGGAVSSRCRDDMLNRIVRLRNHGIEATCRGREEWERLTSELGFNYRISDINCALARSQLKRLGQQIAKRRWLAATYHEALHRVKGVRRPAKDTANNKSAWHLYVIRAKNRKEVFYEMRSRKIDVAVHYPLVYHHPLYAKKGYKPGLCPVAERAYEEILTLPLFGSMKPADLVDVVKALKGALGSRFSK